MEHKKQFIAIYIDLENVTKSIVLKDLMNDISLQYSQEELKPVFAVKIACGHTNAITAFRSQLKELNFEIRETPHIAQKKNRADLIISLDAFEKFYINQPAISLFVFLTNDSDYSVVMDTLRKHGKDVWLVTNEENSKKDFFQNSSDNILLISEYLVEEKDKKEFHLFDLTKDVDIRTVKAMLKILNTLDDDKEYDIGYLNNQFRKIESSIKMKNTSFKNFRGLYKFLSERDIIKFVVTKVKGESDKVSDIDFSKIKIFV